MKKYPSNRGRYGFNEASKKRFMSRTIKTSGGCWVWQGATPRGYGRISVEGRVVQAHRYSYELFVGPIPAGMTIDHLCRVHGCVNPKHLEPVTFRENVLRGTAPTAINGKKTHYKYGHSLVDENNLRALKYGRGCRECHRLREAERRFSKAKAGLTCRTEDGKRVWGKRKLRKMNSFYVGG